MHSVRRTLFAMPFAVILSLLMGAAHGQTTAPPAAADRGLLFKIEKDGKVSYLLGTVHAWKREWLPLPAPVESAFAEAKTLAVEADVAKIDMGAAVQRMMLTGNETLEKRLGTALYQRTTTESIKLGIPEAAINKMKPWGAMLAMAGVQLQQLGFSAEVGIDAYLMQKARAAGKAIIELESGEQQLAMLDSLSPRVQSAMLSDFLANIERTPQVIDGVVVAWKSGDTGRLGALNDKNFNDPEAKREFEDKFLYQRDVGMTRKIDELLRQPGPHFIAVGSLHVVGPRSIVEQLKAKGFRVEQI